MRLSEVFRPTNTKRTLFFLFGDVVLSLFSLYFAYLLRFNFEIPPQYVASFLKVAFILIPLKILFYFLFKLYFVSWRFFSIYELKRFVLVTFFAYFSFFVIFYLFRKYFLPLPRSAVLIDFFLTLLFLGFFRISKRLFTKIDRQKPLAVLIGANEKGMSLLKQDIPYFINEVYDNDPHLINTYFSGIKVADLKNINTKIKTAIIAKELSRNELDKLVELLQQKGFEEIKIYSPFEERIKDISIEDLLARKPKDLDKDAIKEFVKDKKILITGAGGSIGSEICRLCERYGAKELVLVDNGEFNLYSINEELNIKRKPYLIDVSKFEEIKRVFEKEKPDIVIHAAAYKHVPLCEKNARSAVVNNVLGTKNVIDLAIKTGVKDFILISTDKAVRPTNVMGATKRVCELYAQNVESKNTKISAVRFGNVLGSSGSVIPKFKKLIENNRPLPVTHPEITRYFMLISEACQLVLQAGSLGKNGEIFILDMGEPVKIVDLARKMLKLYGKGENNIVFTGLREGEKLYEELLINEAEKKTKYKDIFVASKTEFDINELNKKIEELLRITAKDEIVRKLKEIVVEFNHKDLK